MLRWLPENIATYGGGVDHVIRVITLIVIPWFILAEAVLFFFIFKYRKKKGVSATYQTGTTWKSLMWLLVPAAAILGFDIGIDLVQGPVWNEIKLYLPVRSDDVIRIKARQFVWEFTQSGRDRLLDTPDDIETINQLTVPVGKKVVFELQSLDVLHSLWIPNLRLKQDAVPGRTIKGWFEATKTGVFPIACAELCGSGHGIMKGELHVLNEGEYEKWLSENSP